MREILFRGKDASNGKWVEGYLASATWYLDDSSRVVIFPTDVTLYPHSEFSEYYEVDPETVGQFTGLLDKNGKKIFEGDVIKTKYGRLCIVVWFANRVHNGWDLDPVRTCENLLRTKPPEQVDLYSP